MIDVICTNCMQDYEVDDQMEGQDVQCQTCGNVFQITAETNHAQQSQSHTGSVKPSVIGDELDALREACPSCGRMTKEGDKVCVNCGWHLKKGKSVKKKVISQSSSPPKKKEDRLFDFSLPVKMLAQGGGRLIWVVFSAAMTLGLLGVTVYVLMSFKTPDPPRPFYDLEGGDMTIFFKDDKKGVEHSFQLFYKGQDKARGTRRYSNAYDLKEYGLEGELQIKYRYNARKNEWTKVEVFVDKRVIPTRDDAWTFIEKEE